MQRPRTPSNLSESLHRQLNSYALAASAAGVGMLALAQPAEGKIVYTPAHKNCSSICEIVPYRHSRSSFFINFGSGNSGYLTDLFIRATGFSGGYPAIAGFKQHSEYFAAALRAGVRVSRANISLACMEEVSCSWTGGKCKYYGPWANGGKGVKNRYLGLKIFIEGKAHYGWARLNVSYPKGRAVKAILTGYAYETIPNKPIITGKTKGPDVITIQPSSLGHLRDVPAQQAPWA